MVYYFILENFKCFRLSSEGKYFDSLFDTTLYPVVVEQGLYCPLGTALNKRSFCEPHGLLGDRLLQGWFILTLCLLKL